MLCIKKQLEMIRLYKLAVTLPITSIVSRDVIQFQLFFPKLQMWLEQYTILYS